MKKKNAQVSVLGQTMQDALRDFADKEFFDTRKALNEEAVTYLNIEENLKNDVREIRKRLKIPKLNPRDDIFTFDASEHSIEADSEWLFRRSSQSQEEFLSEVEQLMKKYSLPKNFYDWLQFYILYDKEPPWKPLYNWDLLEQIMKDTNESERIPLTTKEKKFVRWAFRYITKSKSGRPKKEYQKAYGELLEALSKSKNSTRRSRVLRQAIETLDKGEIEKYYDPVEGKNVIERPTYKKLAVKIDMDASNKERDRLAATLRKQNERLKKRMVKTIKPQR